MPEHPSLIALERPVYTDNRREPSRAIPSRSRNCREMKLFWWPEKLAVTFEDVWQKSRISKGTPYCARLARSSSSNIGQVRTLFLLFLLLLANCFLQYRFDLFGLSANIVDKLKNKLTMYIGVAWICSSV